MWNTQLYVREEQCKTLAIHPNVSRKVVLEIPQSDALVTGHTCAVLCASSTILKIKLMCVLETHTTTASCCFIEGKILGVERAESDKWVVYHQSWGRATVYFWRMLAAE